MAAAKPAKNSIATSRETIRQLEQDIAKLSAALDRARAQELAAAEKAVSTGKKAWQSAKKNVADLTAKGSKTPAAKARLDLAKKDLAQRAAVVVSAQATLAALTSAQTSRKEVAKELAKQLKSNAKKTPAKKVAVKPAAIKTVDAALVVEPVAVAIPTVVEVAPAMDKSAEPSTTALPFDDDKGALN